MSEKETKKAKSADAAPKAAKAAKGGDKGAAKPAEKGKGKGKDDAAPKADHGPVPEPRLREKYNATIRPALVKEFNYQNPMAIPRVTKVAINVGVAEAKTNIKLMDEAVDILSALSGQKAVVRRSRKAISNFKLRENQPIGASVTLRGRRMWEFLDRLFSLALPRVRDFRGVSERAFDGRGSYTLGVKDQLIFPEVDYSKVTRTMGMNISIVTTAKTDPEARALLTALGMPFRKAR